MFTTIDYGARDTDERRSHAANIYQELLWPVIDLYLRIVYANTPFLYPLHTAYQPSTGSIDGTTLSSESDLVLEGRLSQEEESNPLLG